MYSNALIHSCGNKSLDKHSDETNVYDIFIFILDDCKRHPSSFVQRRQFLWNKITWLKWQILCFRTRLFSSDTLNGHMLNNELKFSNYEHHCKINYGKSCYQNFTYGINLQNMIRGNKKNPTRMDWWRAANFDLCSTLMAIEHGREGSLACHTYCDTFNIWQCNHYMCSKVCQSKILQQTVIFRLKLS